MVNLNIAYRNQGVADDGSEGGQTQGYWWWIQPDLAPYKAAERRWWGASVQWLPS